MPVSPSPALFWEGRVSYPCNAPFHLLKTNADEIHLFMTREGELRMKENQVVHMSSIFALEGIRAPRLAGHLVEEPWANCHLWM